MWTPRISGSLEESSPPGGAGGSWTSPREAEPEAGVGGAALGEAVAAGAALAAGAAGAGADEVPAGAAGFAVASGGGQGAGADFAAGCAFLLKTEPRDLNESFTFCAACDADWGGCCCAFPPCVAAVAQG